MISVRRTDNGAEIPASRQEMIDALRTLDPQFDPDGKSDDAVRARYDLAREQATQTRTDAIDPDEVMRRSRERAANAWKGSPCPLPQRTDSREQRAAAGGMIDPDASRARMVERNQNAWRSS